MDLPQDGLQDVRLEGVESSRVHEKCSCMLWIYLFLHLRPSANTILQDLLPLHPRGEADEQQPCPAKAVLRSSLEE